MDVFGHVFSRSCEKMCDIAAPLKQIEIDFFAYLKTCSKQQHILLCTDQAWLHQFYDAAYCQILVRQIPAFKGSLLWSSIDPEPIFKNAREQFGYASGLVIVEPSSNNVERYLFASKSAEAEVGGIYGYNLDVFHRFIHFFKDQCAELIESLDKNALPIISESANTLKIRRKTHKAEVIQFFQQTPVKRFNIKLNGQDVFIPKREAQIMAMMRVGLTAKEMAKKLDISHRTIEFYRNNLKRRLEVFEPFNPLKVIYQCDNINTRIVGDDL